MTGSCVNLWEPLHGAALILGCQDQFGRYTRGMMLVPDVLQDLRSSLRIDPIHLESQRSGCEEGLIPKFSGSQK
jgi:hypothetical protein